MPVKHHTKNKIIQHYFKQEQNIEQLAKFFNLPDIVILDVLKPYRKRATYSADSKTKFEYKAKHCPACWQYLPLNYFYNSQHDHYKNTKVCMSCDAKITRNRETVQPYDPLQVARWENFDWLCSWAHVYGPSRANFGLLQKHSQKRARQTQNKTQ